MITHKWDDGTQTRYNSEMLSRREKLLVQPWEDRRFQDHRSKVKSALPAIDNAAPAARAHVTLKLKKCQRERDRTDRIARDNFSLLQRLHHIMRVNRLDNHWQKPLPNFHQKVGMFSYAASLRARTSTCSPPSLLSPAVKCYACDLRRRKMEEEFTYEGEARTHLPAI